MIKSITIFFITSFQLFICLLLRVLFTIYEIAILQKTLKAVVLKLGSIEPRGFDESVSGVRRRSG